MCGGEPHIDGSRLTCADVVSILNNILTIKEFLKTYNYLQISDVLDTLEYCSTQQCCVDNVVNYCSRCTLDKREDEEPSFFIESPEKFREFIEGSKGNGYLGTKENYMNEEKKDMWRSANILFENLINKKDGLN